MNIFMLDTDPTFCAQYHIDRHVTKMLVEYAQIMSTAHNECNGQNNVYRSFNPKHPSCIWAMESKDNYTWLYNLWSELFNEYRYRFYKVTHKSYDKLHDKLKHVPNGIPDVPMTQMRLAMPEQYQCNDPVKAYRDYYNNEKKYDTSGKFQYVWRRRGAPKFAEVALMSMTNEGVSE